MGRGRNSWDKAAHEDYMLVGLWARLEAFIDSRWRFGAAWSYVIALGQRREAKAWSTRSNGQTGDIGT